MALFLLFLLVVWPSAAQLAGSRGRPAVERLAPDRLAAVHAARARLARERKVRPATGPFKDFRVVLHIHAEDATHTLGTRAEVLRAAHEAGVSVVMFTDHRGPKLETWQGFRDGTLFFAGGEGDHRQTYPNPAPGLRFHCHVEEQMDAAVDGLDGMEIYNRHTDLTDDQDLVGYLRGLALDSVALRAFADLVRRYPDEIYGAGAHYWPDIFARWDKILETRHFAGVSANDAHQNQVFSDGAGGKITLDPYAVAFRNVSTHVLARSLDELSVQEALRRGRGYISHDWLCEPAGFSLVAVAGKRTFSMGDSVPIAKGTRLEIRLPHPALIRVIRRGSVVAQATAAALKVPVKEPGAWRVEAWLEIDGEMRPWIYSNPVYAERR